MGLFEKIQSVVTGKNYDPGRTSRMLEDNLPGHQGSNESLEKYLPKKLARKIGPYEHFIYVFLSEIVKDPQFSSDTGLIEDLSLSISNTHRHQDLTRKKSFSFAYLMGDDWQKVEKSYQNAIERSKENRQIYPDFYKDSHRFMYEDLAEAMEILLKTTDFINRHR